MARSLKLLTFALLIAFLNSCCKKPENQSTSQTPEDLATDTTSLARECEQRDMITKLGTKIHYIFKDDAFKISWGDGTYTRTYDSSFTCHYDSSSGTWDFVPKYYAETQNHLVFRYVWWTSSGGNPAPLEYSSIVLPKNANDSIYEKEFFIDKIDDYLIYGDMDYQINILNLETKKVQSIIPDPLLAISRGPTMAIIDTKIIKNKLSISYETIVADSVQIVRKNFKLVI